MRSKTLLIGLAVIAISALIVGIVVTVISNDLLRKGVNMNEQETRESWVIASEDELLGEYEKSDKQFKKGEIGGKIVYWHQRMIDNATVAGDYLVYIFDKDTKELLEKRIHWQSDLPEHVTTKITKEQAESMVRGEVQFTTLYFRLPDSPVFPIEPAPKNPCWVVSSIDWKGNKIVTVIDAVEGKILGYGVPPP
jgi:hypothetical protein